MGVDQEDNVTNNKILFTKALFTCWDWEWVPKFESNMSHLIYQHEICPTTGKRHIQGYVEFAIGKRVRRSFFDKWKGKATKPEFEGTGLYVKRVSTDNGCGEYCHKDETSVPDTRVSHGTPRGNDDKEIEKKDLIKEIEQCKNIREVLRLNGVKKTNFNWAKEIFNTKLNKMTGIIKTLRPWQKYIINKLNQSNDREVLFVVDFKGGNGKTELARWMFNKYEDDVFFCQGGKYCDIIHAYGGQKYVIMDLPRATNPEHVSYHALESFKDGQGFSGKYQSVVKVFNRPKVIVFTNKELLWENLTDDRFKNTRFYLNNDDTSDHKLLSDIMMWDHTLNEIDAELEHDDDDEDEPQHKTHHASEPWETTDDSESI